MRLDCLSNQNYPFLFLKNKTTPPTDGLAAYRAANGRPMAGSDHDHCQWQVTAKSGYRPTVGSNILKIKKERSQAIVN